MTQAYSPSSLTVFHQCERRWLLERKWQQRIASKATVASWIGRGVAAGMEAFHKGEVAGQVVDTEAIAGIAAQAAEDDRQAALLGGLIIPHDLEMEATLVGQRASTAVSFLLTKQPMREDFRTVAAELSFTALGSNARADLVVDSIDGIMVLDYKTRVSTTRYMLDKAEREYEHSTQLYYYASMLRKMGHNVEAVGIAMVVIEPKPRLHLWTYTLNEELLLQYERSWAKMWERMALVESGQEEPVWAPTHTTPFGPCPWQSMCLDGWQEDIIERGEKR